MEKLVPKLRFPEFEGNWEKKKIGEVCEVSSGGTPSRSKPNYWNGNIPWVSTTLIDFNIIGSQLFTNIPSNYIISFYEDINATIPISIPFVNSTPNQQMIYAKISNIQNNCYPIYPIELNINTFEDNILNETIEYCAGNSVELEADSGYPFYQWETGENSQSIIVNTPGNYNVTIGNSLNCTKQKTFTVIPSEIATIENIVINGFDVNSNINVKIYDLLGRLVEQHDKIANELIQNPIGSNLTSGVFNVIVTQNDTVKTLKVIKR